MNTSTSNNGTGGPCGACKFLRRKCVKNCVFAPYFDSNEIGTTHFAAVHKVFGASNAAKLLLRLPPHRRLEAVVSLCYEALSRVRDPVYGCVANILTLQQQVVNLQTELTYIRGRVSMLQRPPQPNLSSNDFISSPKLISSSSISSIYLEHTNPEQMSPIPRSGPIDDIPTSQQLEDSDLQMLAREYVSKYMP